VKTYLSLKLPNKIIFTVLCGSLLIWAAVGVAPAQKTKTKQPTAPRFVHEPDLKTLLPRFLTTQGFLDPKYAAAIAKPSPYYTDFYGIQALADTTRERIKRDFVPKYSEIAAEDENSITLKFKNGWTGKFYPHSTLKIMGTETPFDHVEISGATWQELLKNLEEFRGIVQAARLEKRYLIPNPFYEDELVVAKNYAGDIAPAQLIVSPTLAEMRNETNAVLIYKEGLHGNVEGYDKFKRDVLDKNQFDWIGMEMLSPTQQKDLDAFVDSADGTPEYNRARKALIDYFTTAWNGRAGPKTTGEENYYFKIVDQMRARKTRVVGLEGVIGLEGSSIAFILFRGGENSFGGAVRSYQWAKNVPKKGRGLIFGGSAHFTESRPVNFQDFLKLVNPNAKIFVMEPLKMRSSAE
jgi:hypothetical protein